MKRIFTLTLTTLAASSSFAFSFSDIRFWAGTGSHQAGLVIQWSDGNTPQSLAWGYRFDGVKTGEDMFRAVVAADPRLFAYTDQFSWGYAAYGIGYDADGDGVIGTGYTTGATPDDALANDSDDRWRTGWLTNGYWSYWTGSDGSEAAGWASASFGMSDRTLGDGSWDALSFAPAPNWTADPPSGIEAAVPEPGSLLAVAGGLAAFAWRRSRGR